MFELRNKETCITWEACHLLKDEVAVVWDADLFRICCITESQSLAAPRKEEVDQFLALNRWLTLLEEDADVIVELSLLESVIFFEKLNTVRTSSSEDKLMKANSNDCRNLCLQFSHCESSVDDDKVFVDIILSVQDAGSSDGIFWDVSLHLFITSVECWCVESDLEAEAIELVLNLPLWSLKAGRSHFA